MIMKRSVYRLPNAAVHFSCIHLSWGTLQKCRSGVIVYDRIYLIETAFNRTRCKNAVIFPPGLYRVPCPGFTHNPSTVNAPVRCTRGFLILSTINKLRRSFHQ